MKRIYIKKSPKWTIKKVSKHSLTIYKSIIILMALFTLWAYINRQVNKNPLISPLVSTTVPQVMASEVNYIPKEQTRWFRLYKFVRFVESNNGIKGLAVTCKKKGMVNSIGYRALEGFCFNSQEEEEITFSNWVNKRYNNGMSERALLCQYNSGRAVEDCPYVNLDLSNAN